MYSPRFLFTYLFHDVLLPSLLLSATSYICAGEKNREKKREIDIGRQKFLSQSFDMLHDAKMKIPPKHSGDAEEGWARVC